MNEMKQSSEIISHSTEVSESFGFLVKFSSGKRKSSHGCKFSGLSHFCSADSPVISSRENCFPLLPKHVKRRLFQKRTSPRMCIFIYLFFLQSALSAVWTRNGLLVNELCNAAPEYQGLLSKLSSPGYRFPLSLFTPLTLSETIR